MPEGVAVLVEDGFATIDTVDPKLRGQVVAALLEHTPPEFIETLTRTGPRRLYRVPEGNARAAGLLDSVSVVDALDVPDTSSASDVSGFVPADGPSTTNLHAQTVRSGSYADAYALPGELGELTVPGDGIAKHGTEFPADGVMHDIGDGNAAAVQVFEKTWPDGDPSEDWTRPQLDAYAAAVRNIDTTGLPKKAAVLDALKA